MILIIEKEENGMKMQPETSIFKKDELQVNFAVKYFCDIPVHTTPTEFGVMAASTLGTAVSAFPLPEPFPPPATFGDRLRRCITSTGDLWVKKVKA
jgi:hypothetical protein